MKAIILKTVLDMALGAITIWCVFTICHIKETLRARDLKIEKMDSRLKGVEIIQAYLAKNEGEGGC